LLIHLLTMGLVVTKSLLDIFGVETRIRLEQGRQVTVLLPSYYHRSDRDASPTYDGLTSMYAGIPHDSGKWGGLR
jgi:hypothetical protein